MKWVVVKADLLDYESLNPGIRESVRFLRAAGFETCDSGDGVTREHECDPGVPYVVVREPHAELVVECARDLKSLLESRGLEVVCGPESVEQLGAREVVVEASYDPVSDVAVLVVTGITDAKLAAASGAK